MESRIESLRAEALSAIEAANDPRSLEAARVKYLGKSGEISRLSEGMREVAKEDRPRLGKLLNQLRQEVQASLEERERALGAAPKRASFWPSTLRCRARTATWAQSTL